MTSLPSMPDENVELSAIFAKCFAQLAEQEGCKATIAGSVVHIDGVSVKFRAWIEGRQKAHGRSVIAMAAGFLIGTFPVLVSGTVGIGENDTDAFSTALQEWMLLTGTAIVHATKNGKRACHVGAFNVHPGATGIRGQKEQEKISLPKESGIPDLLT